MQSWLRCIICLGCFREDYSCSRILMMTRQLFERIADMPEKPITIYSLSTCSHCKSTKKFLSECTVKYEFVNVDLLEGDERKAILNDVKKLNPKCSFPTIMIGEKVIVGYKEDEIKEALGL